MVALVEIKDALAQLGAATLGESGGRPCSPTLKAAWPGATVCGQAWTADCPDGDNLALHVAVTTAETGTVIVGRAHPLLGNWGEVLATAAASRGLVGLVLDGGTRDTREQQEMGFPVFSTGICLPGAQKVGPGRVGGPVMVGGVLVHAGDWIVADADGVVVVELAMASAVIDAGTARVAKEAMIMESLRAGATTIELLDLDPSAVEVLR
jgi:4-hydroxy-4-methyl-2-oxoglutarate aldolase